MRKSLMTGLLLATSIFVTAETADLNRFFHANTFLATAPETQIISEKSVNGIKITELKFNGGVINGKPTRIYAWYTRPEKGTSLPAVVEIHGAGLNKLEPNLRFPQNGFACLSIDWAGEAPARKVPRQPPFSEFVSNGNMADPRSGKWQLTGVETDGIRTGVIFARRALEFLRQQPDIDRNHIFTVGSSAGAHLSLLLLGLEPDIKASVVKYGTGYIRDIPGWFGGYFGPISLCPKEQQDNWLAHFDPCHLIKNYKTRVLLLSGTDDIFFWMPLVLKTYREIPSQKRLLMRPNDNHQLVGTEEISLKFFREAMTGSPDGWPQPGVPTLVEKNTALEFSTVVSSKKPLKNVSLIYKVMPLPFEFKGAPQYPWLVVPMQSTDNRWTVAIPSFDKEHSQLVAYVNAEDIDGNIASSDTIEYPEWPRWRGLPGTDRHPAVNTAVNLLEKHGEFETKSGFNYVGQATINTDAAHVHSGKGAAYVFDGDKNYLAIGIPGIAGKKFVLKGWFKSAAPAGGSARLQINWADSKPFKYELSTPSIGADYQELKLEGVIPPGTTGGTLIITSPGQGMYVDDLDFRLNH